MSFNQFDNDFHPKKSGVIMRVDPAFKNFCEEISENYNISQTEATREILKKVKRGIVTWI